MRIYATVITKSPTSEIMAITMLLLLGSRINIQAATPLVNHKETKVVITRLKLQFLDIADREKEREVYRLQ